jgi:hypothetical protein
MRDEGRLSVAHIRHMDASQFLLRGVSQHLALSLAGYYAPDK